MASFEWPPQGGGGTPSYPLLAPNGSAAAPSYGFTSSAGVGMYSSGTGVLDFATASTDQWRIDASGNLLPIGGGNIGSNAIYSNAVYGNTFYGLNGFSGTVFYFNGISTNVEISANSATTNYGLTLPAAVASSSGQALTSDTSGNLSWSNISSIAGYSTSNSTASGFIPAGGGSGSISAGTVTFTYYFVKIGSVVNYSIQLSGTYTITGTVNALAFAIPSGFAPSATLQYLPLINSNLNNTQYSPAAQTVNFLVFKVASSTGAVTTFTSNENTGPMTGSYIIY